MGFVVDLRVLEEDAKLSVQTCLNLLAVRGKNARLGREFDLLMIGVHVLLKTLHRRNPRRFTDEGCNLRYLRLNGWKYLNARRTITNQANVLACKINIVVPVGSVQQSAFVLRQPGNRRPSPIVENATGVDQDIAVILDFSAISQIIHRHIVSTLLMIPERTGHLMSGFDVLFKVVLIGEVVEVLIDLLAAGIYARPVEFWFE